MGIRAHVSAYLSSLVRVPVTLGLLKPVILLPVAMVTQLTTAQIEAILVHELAHIRRKDYLLNLLITAMELLFFFNPFTRLLIGQLKNEREHCCDDAVLECRYDPHGYVSALLSLARQQQPTGIALAAIGGGGEQLLLQRARKILQQKRSDDRPGPRPLIGLLLTALFSVLLLGHVRPVHTARIQAQTHPPLPAPRQYPAFRPETMSFVIINTPAIGAAPTFPRTTANARTRMIPSAKMTPRTSTSPQAKSAPRTLAAPPSAAAASLAAQTHRHPAHPHPKRPSQDMLEAMLAESVPVLNTAGPMTMPAFTDLMETASRADRDFSIGRSTTTTQDDPDPMADNMPFVPQSSFSFQYTDTLPPGEKLALMQELSQKSLHLQIARIEAELKQQQSLLHRQEAAIRRASAEEFRSGLGNTLDTRSLQQLLQQQLQVQRQYILNLQKLQRQLKKASRHLTIVYI
jgi:beta-lactamase regulating signal transducer with metallopeptidase domain